MMLLVTLTEAYAGYAKPIRLHNNLANAPNTMYNPAMAITAKAT